LNAESGGEPFSGKLVMTADLFHGQIAPNRAESPPSGKNNKRQTI
jgi:hypothetical protein